MKAVAVILAFAMLFAVISAVEPDEMQRRGGGKGGESAPQGWGPPPMSWGPPPMSWGPPPMMHGGWGSPPSIIIPMPNLGLLGGFGHGGPGIGGLGGYGR